MTKQDKIIEVLAWIIIIMIVGICFWLNYEMSIPGDGKWEPERPQEVVSCDSNA